mgnify:FL=1
MTEQQHTTIPADTGEAQAKQLPLFPVDKHHCGTFLTNYLTIADEMDRLREETQALMETYHTLLPLRAVQTAIKVVRARKKLAEHHKEPMGYDEQMRLEAFVQEHITTMDSAKHEALDALTHMLHETVTLPTGTL